MVGSVSNQLFAAHPAISGNQRAVKPAVRLARGSRASPLTRRFAPGDTQGRAVQGHALRRRRALGSRRHPAAEAIPDQRTRLARLVAAVRVVSLELRPLNAIRAPRVLRYVLLGCAVLGTIFLFL